MSLPNTAGKGFTLIELMVSLGIGMLVTLLALSFYSGTLANRRTVEGRLALQEEEYFVTQIIERFVAEAGFRALADDDVMGSLLPMPPLASAFPATDGGWARGHYVRAIADGFAIRFRGSSRADGSADGSIADCAGRRFAANEAGGMSFHVDSGRLVCAAGDVDVTLAGSDEGVLVEALSLRFGIDENGDSNPDRLRAATDYSPTPGESIVSLRVDVLLASADRVLSASQGYTFDGAEYTTTDKRLRREAVISVGLRN